MINLCIFGLYFKYVDWFVSGIVFIVGESCKIDKLFKF